MSSLVSQGEAGKGNVRLEVTVSAPAVRPSRQKRNAAFVSVLHQGLCNSYKPDLHVRGSRDYLGRKGYTDKLWELSV